jgi:hypothetical protein
MELSAIRSLFGLLRQCASHIPKLLPDNQCRFVGGYLLIEPVSGRQDIVKELMQRAELFSRKAVRRISTKDILREEAQRVVRFMVS